MNARDQLLGALTRLHGWHHDQANTLIDDYAHELAEQQRHHFGIGDAPVKAHCDPDCDFCRGVSSAADLIDPEVQRTTSKEPTS